MKDLQKNTTLHKRRTATKISYFILFIVFFYVALNYYATERPGSNLLLSTYINLQEYFFTSHCLVCTILQGKLSLLKQSMPSFLSTAGTCFLFKFFDNTRDSIRIPLEISIVMTIFEFIQIFSSKYLTKISMSFDWLDIASIALGGFIGALTIKTIEVATNEND